MGQHTVSTLILTFGCNQFLGQVLMWIHHGLGYQDPASSFAQAGLIWGLCLHTLGASLSRYLLYVLVEVIGFSG